MTMEVTPVRHVATWTRSFAAAAWLCAKGHEAAVEKAKDGSGGIVYRFPPAAFEDLQAFYVVKDRLNDMSLAARQIGN